MSYLLHILIVVIQGVWAYGFSKLGHLSPIFLITMIFNPSISTHTDRDFLFWTTLAIISVNSCIHRAQATLTITFWTHSSRFFQYWLSCSWIRWLYLFWFLILFLRFIWVTAAIRFFYFLNIDWLTIWWRRFKFPFIILLNIIVAFI